MSRRDLTREEKTHIILALEDRADKLWGNRRPESDAVVALIALLSEADAVTVTDHTPREPIIV